MSTTARVSFVNRTAAPRNVRVPRSRRATAWRAPRQANEATILYKAEQMSSMCKMAELLVILGIVAGIVLITSLLIAKIWRDD
jgi:hypothetical protein